MSDLRFEVAVVRICPLPVSEEEEEGEAPGTEPDPGGEGPLDAFEEGIG